MQVLAGKLYVQSLLVFTTWFALVTAQIEGYESAHTRIVLVLASQRAGVSLSGCLAGKLAETKNLGYEYSSAPVGPETIAQAMNRFRKSPSRPPLMLTSGEKMAETCYETKDGELLRCPTDKNTCPCVQGKLVCMALGYCWHSLPNIPLKVVNFIRNPVDTVISSYAYHVQDPAPEAWLKDTPAKGYANWMMDQGLDEDELEPLGLMKLDPKISYHEFLRSIPPGRGVQLEFFRISYYLWGMARQHRRFKTAHMPADQFLEMRFEDFMGLNFRDAARQFLSFVNVSTPEEEAGILQVMSTCEDSKGQGLKRRKLLAPAGDGIGVDMTELLREYDQEAAAEARAAVSGGARRSARSLSQVPPETDEEEEPSVDSKFADLINQVVAQTATKDIVRTQAAEDIRQEQLGNKMILKDKQPPPAADEGKAVPAAPLAVEEKPFEEQKQPETPVSELKADPHVDFKLGKKESAALAKALMKNPFIEDQLCQMLTILGYDDNRCQDASSLTANPFT